jgi:hypothetical protein
MAASDDHLAPIRAMLATLDDDRRTTLARAFHQHLNALLPASERRVAELGFLARLLGEQLQDPDHLPYIARKLYDVRRSANPSLGPSSAALQKRFGSWARACHAAWGLLDDGRSWGPGQPWPRPPRHPQNYEKDDATRSVRACTSAIGHIPSSFEYHRWVINRRARARGTGTPVRPYVPIRTVYRLIAPDRSDRNGWQLVIARLFGQPRV